MASHTMFILVESSSLPDYINLPSSLSELLASRPPWQALPLHSSISYMCPTGLWSIKLLSTITHVCQLCWLPQCNLPYLQVLSLRCQFSDSNSSSLGKHEDEVFLIFPTPVLSFAPLKLIMTQENFPTSQPSPNLVAANPSTLKLTADVHPPTHVHPIHLPPTPFQHILFPSASSTSSLFPLSSLLSFLFLLDTYMTP